MRLRTRTAAWPSRGSGRPACILISVACLALMVLGGSALAAPGSPAPAARPDYGIRPVFHGDTTLPGDHYTFALEPGTAIDDAVVIINYTDDAAHFDLYGADLILTEGGGFAPAAREAEPRGSGAWITPSEPTVEVPANSRLSVPFTVAVPAGAVPGDHPGTIVVEQRVSTEGRGVTVQPRLALRVQLTVPGEVDLGVALGPLDAERTDAGVRFTVAIANTGNVTFTTAGSVTIDGRAEPASIDLRPDGLYAIPGGEATLWSVWEDPPWLGRVRAHADIDVIVGDREPVPYATESITVWLIPWRTLLITLAVVALLIGILVSTRDRRARWRRRRREERVLLQEFREQWTDRPPSEVTQGTRGSD